MRLTPVILASILLAPALVHATPDPSTATPLRGEALAAPAPLVAPGIDLPYVVDEAGDTIEGDLTITGTLHVNSPATLRAPLHLPGEAIHFDGGVLRAEPALTFDGVAVCLADSTLEGCAFELEDGSVTPAKLAFDPATQAELDAFQDLLASPGDVNQAGNPVHWGQLVGVPAGFADGVDHDTLYRDADAVAAGEATGFVRSTDLAEVAFSGSFADLAEVPAGLADGDDDTTYSAGTGLVLSGTTFSADTSVVQQRVASSCAVGSSIRAIAGDGSVTCER